MMERPSRKTHQTMAGASGRVKRSELDDAMTRSLNREGILLNNTLKQYDRAKKVVKKGLESNERQTAKFTQKIRSLSYAQALALNSETGAKESRDPNPFSSPRRELSVYDRGFRAKSAKYGGWNESGNTEKKGHEKGKSNVGRNQHPELDTKENPGEGYALDFADNQPQFGARRERTRTEMFNNLSKPKKKSDVLSVRARLRAEFDTPKPQMSRGFLVRSTTCPDIATMHGSRFPTGKFGSPLEVTPRTRPNRKLQELLGTKSTLHPRKDSEPSSVTTADGQPLTEGDIKALLVPPKPVVVKR